MASLIHALWNFPPDCWEPLARGLSAYTIEPYKNVLQFFVPYFWTWFANCSEPRHHSLDDKEVVDLKEAANLSSTVIYTATVFRVSHCGGTISPFPPAILIPQGYLAAESNERPLTETEQFLILRELCQIKNNSSLVRIAIKVTMAVALYSIFTSAVTLSSGGLLCLAILGLHARIEHHLQVRADLNAVTILRENLGKVNATEIAIQALKEIQAKFIERRTNNILVRIFLINKKGDYPLLSQYINRRIQNLERLNHA